MQVIILCSITVMILFPLPGAATYLLLGCLSSLLVALYWRHPVSLLGCLSLHYWLLCIGYVQHQWLGVMCIDATHIIHLDAPINKMTVIHSLLV